jgi:hypothetical protein
MVNACKYDVQHLLLGSKGLLQLLFKDAITKLSNGAHDDKLAHELFDLRMEGFRMPPNVTASSSHYLKSRKKKNVIAMGSDVTMESTRAVFLQLLHCAHHLVDKRMYDVCATTWSVMVQCMEPNGKTAQEVCHYAYYVMYRSMDDRFGCVFLAFNLYV